MDDDIDEWTVDRFIGELYLSAYINDDGLDDVDPGYEYATQQLLTDLRSRLHWFDVDVEIEMMQESQQRAKDMEVIDDGD